VIVDPAQHVGEPGLRIDVVEFGRHDQRVHRAGALATAIYASTKNWAVVIPTIAWVGGITAALVIGTIAGLLPAIRAARLQPTDALRAV